MTAALIAALTSLIASLWCWSLLKLWNFSDEETKPVTVYLTVMALAGIWLALVIGLFFVISYLPIILTWRSLL